MCSPNLAPVLAEDRNWRWVLNRNQDLLGRSMLVLRRHASRLTELTEPEWMTSTPSSASCSDGWNTCCPPTRLNYVFLGNVDDHVHLHIVPRYAEPVPYAGERFEDVGFPGHYSVDEPHLVSDDLLPRIARDLRIALARRRAVPLGGGGWSR